MEGLGLPYEVVGGSSASLRLRVLPPAWADRTPEALDAAAAAAGEGQRGKEYW